LIAFREYDSKVLETYGQVNPSYNMLYFYDCITALNNILFGVNVDSTGLIIAAFEQRCLFRLEPLIDIVSHDIKQSLVDINSLNAYNCNFVEVLRQFIYRIRECQNQIKDDRAMQLAGVCNILLNDLNDKISTEIVAHKSKAKELTAVVIMEVTCTFMYKNTNEIEKHFRIRSDVSLLELIMQIESRYQVSPIVLTYTSNIKELMVINSEQMLKRALNNAYARSMDKVLRVAFNVRISPRIADSELPIGMLSSGLSVIEEEFLTCSKSWSNLSQKAALLLNLNKSTGFSISDLNSIYAAFYQVAQKKLLEKDKGYLTFPEFGELMQSILKQEHLCNEMFNAIAKGRDRIDFRDLVCTFSILQFGSIEDKIRFIFTVYDTDNSQYINAKKLHELTDSSAKTKDTNLTYAEIYIIVDSILKNFDTDKDGKLSYVEFRNAICSRTMTFEPYWISTAFRFNEELLQLRPN